MDESAPAKPVVSPAKPSIWERQPQGLFLYAVLWVTLCCPGVMTLYILHPLVRFRSLAWAIGEEASFAFAALVALGIMIGFVQHKPLVGAGFDARGMVFETLIGLVIGCGLISVVVGILSMTGHMHTVARHAGYVAWPAAVFCLMIAISEETIFRGYMLAEFERQWGTATGLIASSLIFGAMHLVNVQHEPLALQLRATLFIAVEAGLLLGAAYLATRRLWMPIGIHWAWNFFLGPYYGVPVSGTNLMGSFSVAHLTGPAWITGGAFGPEAGIVTLCVCSVAAFALLIVTARSGRWRAVPSPVPSDG
ncbi:MAG: CPBP family intramembrane metalloprotease [Capsulimonadaceae bacterium]|nr:CPBP family intramembrane metalloprotease [Capsulimonadaceae bacterium]